MGVNKNLKVVVYFEKPESWKGSITVPKGFPEMEYDEQNDIVQAAVEHLRLVEIDYWDYA